MRVIGEKLGCSRNTVLRILNGISFKHSRLVNAKRGIEIKEPDLFAKPSIKRPEPDRVPDLPAGYGGKSG